MKNTQELKIPFWEQYTLTVEEASAYFRIGIKKLRNFVNENKNADWIIWNNSRPQIKRKLFEQYIDSLDFI